MTWKWCVKRCVIWKMSHGIYVINELATSFKEAGNQNFLLTFLTRWMKKFLLKIWISKV